MNKKIIDLVFMSEKRKKLLLFMKDGPKSMDEIEESLLVDSISILPQLKKLKERSLVSQEGREYKLSLIGRVIAERMRPLVDTVDVLEKNFDYWAQRDLEGVPHFLRERLGDLKNCKLVRPDLNHMFELNPEFVENLSLSKQVMGCASYFNPAFPPLYIELAKKGTEIYFVLTEPVLRRFQTDYREDMSALLGLENVNIFLFPEELKLAGLTVTDRFLLLALSPEGRYFDHESLISFEQEALNWGRELFLHMQKEAVRVREI
ncbi:winged helix-turn-helix domain-containing protein [Methanosarcina sp. KYL-1]|uniref:helix-turn-helix transcriptional regulator n=1 Tax=Methanosarcina sp. KYL-1 TaxID=2602068 RepID=UPI0021009C3F|nr:winged helix-turn-helix domain-containing protein [Methanosarcina sp. KYL-1]MCQ1535878.1 winged helix-turn-helix domain-containing protein [Methanosarcina sp. KYL-1]